MPYRPRKLQVKHPGPDDARTVWSTWMQPGEVLDVTRELRFRDCVRPLLWNALGLKERGVAVDVGSGSGAFTRALARWMGPGCMVYGVDRDANFVGYAAQRAKEERLSRRCRYLEGDALALPLPDGVADAVTSYSVIEHLADHRAFLRESMRVCRPGGRVSVISVRTEGGISSSAPLAPQPTAREEELWKAISDGSKPLDEQWGIGKHGITLAGLPALLEDLGLRGILIDAFATPGALDDARVSPEQAERQLEVDERMALDNVALFGPQAVPPLSRADLAELKRLVRARYGKRRRLLRRGVHVWDYSVGLSLVVSGRKPG
jgi:SAM-dependent methyltransferase